MIKNKKNTNGLNRQDQSLTISESILSKDSPPQPTTVVNSEHQALIKKIQQDMELMPEQLFKNNLNNIM